MEPPRFRSIAVNDRNGKYSDKVSRFVYEEFLHQARIQEQLCKKVDLDFVIAEAYRCHPDLEENQIKRGVNAQQIERWKEMLGLIIRKASERRAAGGKES